MLNPSRRILMEICGPLYYPFGNTRSRNILEKVGWKIGGEESNVTKVLFLGCGDLRNTFQATRPTPNGNAKNFHIHLNDVDPSLVARNILILKITSARDFNPDTQEDLSFLWDVWYNTEWPENTKRRFQLVLKELLKGSLPENIIISKSSQFQSLKKIWTEWSSLCSKSQADSNLLMKKIKNERLTFMVTCWNRLLPRNSGYQELKLAVNESTISKTIDEMASQFEIALGIDDVGDESANPKIRQEIRQYFQAGSCRLQNENRMACVNPTMLQPTTHRWFVHYTLCPFDGYAPLTKEELDTSVKSGILIQSCQKILKSLLSSYRGRMDDVKIFIHLEDALEFCYADTNDVFDLIDCSNLSDQVGLANLIVAASRRLSDAPGAVLFTESMTWNTLATSLLQYLDEALCAPLSMIPLIYGLRLLNHIELGTPAPVNVDRLSMMEPLNLCWQKAPSFRNMSLQASPALTRCLNRLASKCFVVANEQSKRKPGELVERCGMRSYTPLTFNYIVDSMIQRVGGDRWFEDARDRLDIPSSFHLNQITTEAWKNGESIIKFSTVMQFNSQKSSFERTSASITKNATTIFRRLFGTPFLRLVLVPQTALMQKEAAEGSDESFFGNLLSGLNGPVHYIDNIKLEVTKRADDEIDTVSISFPLIPRSGVEGFCGYVLDMLTGLPFFVIPVVASLTADVFCLPYPIHRGGTQLPLSPASQMVVKSCLESDFQYHLKISIACEEAVSGLKVSTDQQKPCESAHEVILTLKEPTNIKPLTLSFPHPIIVDDIRATLFRKDHSVDMILTKAVREPWPVEFRAADNSRLIVERLKPWKENNASFLEHHLNTQFNITMLMKPSDALASALNRVREIIKTIFLQAIRGQEFFAIKRPEPSSSTEKIDWWLRVHMPVRISPNRGPILMLTALDYQLSENLTKSGTQSKQEATADFFRIFNQASKDVMIKSEEDAQLLRYVLRLNSTKMVASTWHKKNLPSGENSPWLATFISPLYNEYQLRSADIASMSPDRKFTGSPSVEEERSCANCEKTSQNLKRCSRCRATEYCSVECQRTHWIQHKIVCSKKSF